ncbi:TPA: LytTR family DNA-binding domain-containing protein, partial [Streptococcus suis]
LEDSDFQKAVSDVLVHAFENIDHTIAENSFIYKTETAHIQVPFSDILYFETSSTIHKVILKTKTGQTEFYGKVSDIAKADERLYQAHRSCVVNPLNITRLDRTNHIAYFENGDSCFVSRLKQGKLVELVEKNNDYLTRI